ncbi:MAG: sugar phosphate isomerase/epimerase [Lentisphaerae bacterium]|nr:sugar phosphate isomerase/epimerase [Lentisphaerota bacterium]
MNQIGTLIRYADITPERLAFYRQIGLDSIQLGGVYSDLWADTPEAHRKSEALFELLSQYDLAVAGLFLAYPGQDWKNPENTVGLVPTPTRTERLQMTFNAMQWAQKFNIKYISCHAGFIPESDDENTACLLGVLKKICQQSEAMEQFFLLETGTETVHGLQMIFERVNSPALGLNFDPANMLYYDLDDPSEVIKQHFERIKIVHCKDAVRPAPGEKYGHETILGQGGTNFANLIAMLRERTFPGAMIIERELPFGPEQQQDVANAVKLLRQLL